MPIILLWIVIAQVDSFCKNSSSWTHDCAFFISMLYSTQKFTLKKILSFETINTDSKSRFGIQKLTTVSFFLFSFCCHSPKLPPKALDASGCIAEESCQRKCKKEKNINIFQKYYSCYTSNEAKNQKNRNRYKLKLWYNFSRWCQNCLWEDILYDRGDA